MTCSHCGNPAHLDFEDGREHCGPCHRIPAFCRCAPVKAAREALWITRSRERRNGLARDLTAA